MSSRVRVTTLATAVPVAMALIALLALSATLVQADPGLTIEKYAPDVAIAGTELFYNIRVSNDAITDTDATVSDTLPPEVTYIADTGNCTEAAGVLTCPLGDLEAYAYREFEVKTYVPPDAVAGEDNGTIVITNTASVRSEEEYAETSERTFVEDQADLRVVKMSKPDTVIEVGQEFEYTIFVDNLGSSAARNVVVTDTLITEGLVDVQWCGIEIPSSTGIVTSTCDYGAQSGVFTFGTFDADPLWPVSPDDPGRVTIRIVAIALEGGDINNMATVTADTPDPNQSNNVYYDFLSAEDVADLAIEKRVYCEGPDDECIAGAPVEFDIAVYNSGPSTAANVVVEDLLPAGVSVVDVYGDGTCTTGIPGDPSAPLTCNLGSIASGEDSYITVDVLIDPDYPLLFDAGEWVGLLENDAWVYSDTFDDDNADNRASVIEQVFAYSQLGATKQCDGTVVAGEELEYVIQAYNQGPSTLHNLRFADPLPQGVTFLGYEFLEGSGACSYFASQHTVVCSLGDVDPGEWRFVKLTVRVNPDYDGDFVYNDMSGGWWADTYFEMGGGTYCRTDVELLTDLSVEKSVDPLKVYPGYEQLYHVQVTNNGPMDARDVVVTDTLPLSVTYEIDTDDCSLFYEDPDVLECHLGTIPAGQSVGFDISGLVDPAMPAGEITNTVLVSMPYDMNQENNFAWATNVVLEPTVADLGLQKSWVEAPPEWFDGQPFGPEDCYLYDGDLNLYGVRAGCPLRYQLAITNTGPLLAQNVVVEDALPAGVTVDNVGSPQGSCTTGIPGNPAAPLTCNLGNIPRDSGAEIEVFVRTDVNLAWEQLENDAVVSSDVPDPDNGNNRAHVLIWVEPFSFLYLEKTGPEDVMAGQDIEYWINLRNEGPSTAHEVHLDDQLPGGVSLLSADVMVGDGSCAPGSTLCSFGDVEPWESQTVRLRGHVEPWVGPETVITNTAWTWAESPFNQPAPEQPITDTWETVVHSAADLSIRKTADPYKVFAGEQLRYDVSVTNNGPAVAYNVLVTDTLDPGLEYEIDTDSCHMVYSEAITPTMLGSSEPDGEGGYLFSTDLVSGTGTYIGPMPEYMAQEIEYDNLSYRLFAGMGFDPWFWDWWSGYPYDPPRLYELDPASGAPLDYVELDDLCALPGLEFVGDTLYGACSEGPPGFWGGSPDLVTVDPDSGHVSYVGDMDFFGAVVEGLAYDESSATMYGLGVDQYYGDPNSLVTIDLGSGEASWLCDVWDVDDDYPEWDLRALEFGPDGTLYGALTSDSDLVVIDPNPVDDYCPMTHVGDTGFSNTGLTLADLREPLGLECSLGNLQPGETSSFSIWARVKPDTRGMINNRVDVISETPDPEPNNNWDTEANLVLGKADLKVTKYGKPDGEVRAGEELEYWVVVDNLGPGYAHNVVLRDLISTDGEFDLWWGEEDGDGDGEGYSCWASGCGYCEDNSCEYCYRDATLTCRLDDPLPVMTPDDAGRWLLKVWVEADEDQSINNLARVVASDYDPDLSNNEAIAEHEVTAVADLRMDKQAWGEVLVGCNGETELWENEVAAGGTLEYRLFVDNEGPSEAENVVVEDWGLSPFLDIVDVECEKEYGGSCSFNLSALGEPGDKNRNLTCYLGTLEDDEGAQVTITATIPSDVPEGKRLVNDARVYSDVFDDDNSNNQEGNWTLVGRWADLQVEKTQAPEIALPTLGITYSITVTNLGLSDVEGVFVSDTLPVQVLNPTWTCCASDDGQCDCPCEVPVCPPGECPWPDADTGLFAQADIPAGEWVIYTVQGTLDWWPCGPFTNTVEIIPPQSLLHPDLSIDPCPENNVAEAVNDPFCHFDPLVLKAYPGPDSPP